jgi:hypothetical protein
METTKHAPNGAKKRYATYLRPETIRAAQRYAFEHAVPDYQVMQEALEEYLERRRGSAATQLSLT